MTIGQAIKIGQTIYRLAKGVGRFTSGETAILSRFPPNYRPYIKQIIKGANIVTAGGIISDVLQQDYNEYATTPRIPRKYNQFQQKYSPGRSDYSGRWKRQFYDKQRRRYCRPRSYKRSY